MLRVSLTLVGSTLILALTAISTPAVEIGSRCVADGGGEGVFVQTVEAPGGPTYTTPISGILTSWGTTMPGAQSATVRLKIVQPGALPPQWVVLRQGDAVAAAPGVNSYSVRMPVTAGERIGLYSATYAGACDAGPGSPDISATEKFGPDTAPGGTFNIDSSRANSRLALFAVIEPDVDSDGFGDETQDGCPSRADLQIPCPAVEITRMRRKIRSTSLKLTVTTSENSSLTASARVRLPATGSRRARTVKFEKVAAATVAGTAKTIKLKLPRSLINYLKSVSRRSKVKVKVDLAAAGLVNTHTKNYTITLRGRRTK